MGGLAGLAMQAPTTIAEAKARMVAAEGGDYFALAYIQLCGISYAADPTEIPAMVADSKQVAPWGDGRWACSWGPVLDDEEANLVYVATYYDGASGLPVAAVVVARGTDVTDDAWGDLKEAFEDLAVFSQRELPWLPDSDARVAEGTLDALTTIEGFSSDGVGLRDYLKSFLRDPANQCPVLVVTGHSLGGCMASVIAPWLYASFAVDGPPGPMVPATFAAPTAGNAAFASYLGQTFPYAPRYFNTLDAIPTAWADIAEIKTIYASHGLDTPDWIDWTIDLFLYGLGSASYVQPADSVPLEGIFCENMAWDDEVGAQHDHNMYIALMTGGTPPCAGTTRPRIRHHSHETRVAALAV